MGRNFTDIYSLLHFSVGCLAWFLGLDFWMWAFLQVLFEAFENSPAGVKFISEWLWWWPGGKREPDTYLNSLGDVIWGSLGWLFAFFLKGGN